MRYRLLRESVEQLDHLPGANERDRLDVVLDEVGHEALRFGKRAEPLDTLVVVDKRRIPERERFCAAWRSVVVDEHHVASDQRARKLFRIRDGSAGHEVLWVRVVMAADAFEPTEHRSDV